MEGNSSQQETGLNRNYPIESNVNPGYLKPKIYLSSNTPTATIPESFTRPRVIQWDPHIAAENSTISVVLEQAISESDEIRPMKLVFGQLVVETNQQQQRAPAVAANDLNMSPYWITLVSKVPRFLDTQVETGPQVPVSICVYDNSARENAIDHWNFGVFTYANDTREEGSSGNRKRREPDSVGGSGMYPSSKRPTSMDDEQLFSQLLAPYDEPPEKSSLSPQAPHAQAFIAPQTANPSAILSQIAPTNPPYQQQLNPSVSSQQGKPSSSSSHHEPPTIQPRPYEMQQQLAPSSGPPGGYNEYISNASVPVNIQPNPTQYGAYNLPYSSYPPAQSGNYINAANSSSSSSSSYPSYPPQQSTGSIQPAPPSGTEHPFAGVLSRASLKITGDLMDMTFNWTPEEWQAGRKLIQFWRRQHTTDDTASDLTGEVECGFETISQEEYQQLRLRDSLAKDNQQKKPSPLVVSCIYWHERNDYYITSVDCIYLLEGLIGVQFTVEEKNRIRRNLEGFRPCTVSKCKPDCADFFKLIMGFPHPKPRNIEKDVKVFPWKILPTALQKIIRKYTPSYSSTMAVNLSS